MSSITYTKNKNHIPIPQQPIAPPPQEYAMNQRCIGVLGANILNHKGNRLNYRNYPNRRYQNANGEIYPGNLYRYGIVSQSIEPLAQRRVFRRTLRGISQNRPRSRPNQRRSRSIRRRCRRDPRQIRLNDFMPIQLRQPSPNLSVDFNLATTAAITITTNINNVPIDALPQRATSVTNTPQPFAVNKGNNTNQQQ
ncbi:unnamed protein product [Rotaria sp. Silwood2]|nr:unnamed protein product [Rotaria sp. Silwood2]CAF3046386.1 unnamed protein product [Rotaria sp. Silwood2]CAF4594584.1 unnamed protein product [Rotaria sp. Silwood2]CAF4599909.1 unnamed protein product [Rotaria sp. Silwood2]